MFFLCRKVRGKFGQSEPRRGKRGYSWHQGIGGWDLQKWPFQGKQWEMWTIYLIQSDCHMLWLPGYQQQTGFLNAEQQTSSFQQQQQQQYAAPGGLPPGTRPPSSPAQQPLTPRGGSGSYSQVHTPQPSPIGSANGLQGGHTGMCAVYAVGNDSSVLFCAFCLHCPFSIVLPLLPVWLTK